MLIVGDVFLRKYYSCMISAGTLLVSPRPSEVPPPPMF